jgi:hypothetical protein
MVVLPVEFVEIPRFPGYFYNVRSASVWSIKSGTLKQLAYKRPYKSSPGGFSVSREGIRYTLSLNYLSKLTAKKEPVEYTHIERKK